MSGFVQLGSQPAEDEVLASFAIEPVPGATIFDVAGAIAAESSVGTWTELDEGPFRALDGLKARVYEIKGRYVKIAYPAALFEPGNIPGLLNVILGDVFGLRTVRCLRLLDLHFPEKLVRSFPGPRQGPDGVRGILGDMARPLVAAIIKPRLGLSAREQAGLVYEVLTNGCDLAEDDEKLAGQGLDPFDERVARCLEALQRAEALTGRRLGYIPNITAPMGEMLRRAELVAAHGGRWVAVDVLAAGWAAVQELRVANDRFGLILHGNREMHAVLTRWPGCGVSMVVLAKLCRLAGVDELHVDPVVGKTGANPEEGGIVRRNLMGETGQGETGFPYLFQAWHGLKAVLPVVSGGLSPVAVPALWELFGHEVMLQFGGGIYGHPGGAGAGARAVRQALAAAMAGGTLAEAAERQVELAQALEKWRFVTLKHLPYPIAPVHTRPARGERK